MSTVTTFGLKIRGAKPSGRHWEVESPFDGSMIARVERPDRAAFDQALENAARAFQTTTRTMPAWKRANVLYRVAELIKQDEQELALTIAREGGKPLKDALVEVRRAVNTTKMSGDEALQLNGTELTMDRASGSEDHIAFTRREPVGPVLAISAFNHPVNLICHQVCTAFAAGNSVIVKPATQTQLSCFRIADFFSAAGIDDDVISVVNASGAETEHLVTDPRIRFITFIGGEDVGWNLRRLVKPGVRLALEHGGTGTAILSEKADLATAIPSIVKAAFYHAGQVCVSTQNLFVHESIYEETIARLKTATESLVTGDPTKMATDVGPLIRKSEVDRVATWVKDALDKGAQVVTGGERLSESCYAPTILAHVNAAMTVCCKEVFGPILTLRKYAAVDTVVEEINASPYAFQAAIYSKDIDEALWASRQIEAKGFMINDSTAFRVDWMPFGGKKASGLGVGGIRYSILDMTEEKLIVIKMKPPT